MAEPSLFERVENAVVLGITALLGWVWTSTHKRIGDNAARIDQLEKKMHSDLVFKHDFSEYAERADKSRTELRDNIVHIYDKIDELKTILLTHANGNGNGKNRD